MKKSVETPQKQTMDVIFNIKKFSAIDLILTKATEYVTFGFSFRIFGVLPPLGKFELSLNTHVKIRYFSTCVITAFLRAGNPCIIP